MRGVELIITVNGVRREGQVAKPHPLEAMLASLLPRLGLANAQQSGPPVTVYVAEELLFAKQFSLPLKGGNLRQAIGYQLEMLLPFPQGSYLSAHVIERTRQEALVTLYAVPLATVEPHLRQLVEEGYAIAGLFPEGQRYQGRGVLKKNWGLLLPGDRDGATLLGFAGSRQGQRLLCAAEPTAEEAKALTGCEVVFCPGPSAGSGFEDAASLLTEASGAREFDLLPPAFRRPDYLKRVVAGLALLNLVVLLLLVGVKEYRFQTTSQRVDEEIASLQPKMKKINGLASQEERIRKDINRLEELGRNPNLIALLATLTAKLPSTAYLDQLRLEKKEAAPILFLDGYAEDMGALSESLKGLGEVRLKSTSRRNNKNYFQLEITLP